jgi:hypothetical protein
MKDSFSPLRLNARHWLDEASFAGTRVNGRDAPIAAIRETTSNRPGSDPNRKFDLTALAARTRRSAAASFDHLVGLR